MSLPREQSHSAPGAPPMDDAEQQMRKALGLYGDAPRPRPDGDRTDSIQRAGGGFMQGPHRRRFVQDGEVPVTVVRREAPDAAHSGTGQVGPTSSRLQRAEAALVAETAGRERAEKALHETQSALQTLQTKIGHNDLAKNEAMAASRHHLEEIVALREELAAAGERLREAAAHSDEVEEELRTMRGELTEERRARKIAERLLRESTEEAAILTPYEATSAESPNDSVERAPVRRGRPPAVHGEPQVEPEPVKWWLLPPKTATKRR